MAHASRLQVAAYNVLRRRYGMSTQDAREFCFRAAKTTAGMPMGKVYEYILDGTLAPPTDAPEGDSR